MLVRAKWGGAIVSCPLQLTKEEKAAAKEFEGFKQKAVKLESGRVIHKLDIKKKKTVH